MTETPEMPPPPDLSAVFEEQQKKLSEAYAASQQAFQVFSQRDAEIGALTAKYQEEMIKVLTIAKAVQNPPMAIASIPVVLAAANQAFALAPVADLKLKTTIEAAFAPFKG
ncbi:hypothetical protein [Sneathiella chinensis]|uniref:Phasin domain-containing protein n=1 Tax=Sneathiella chinensis TaxID=349750 RepID=A0ABQ5U4I4_9PROT|nr:hypothetical protein [Sneathiella chinensis]GLQ06237.1 hypothetical protein GCM10007924_14580 [Sneathiella chinensis]